MAPDDTPLAMILLVISLLVALPVGKAADTRSSPIKIKVWPSVNEDESPGQDYGPARVVATMATPFVELIDGGFFRKFHPVWTTVVIRERKNPPRLIGTLYRSHDNRTYVEVPTSGIPGILFPQNSGYVTVRERMYSTRSHATVQMPRNAPVQTEGFVTQRDTALLRIAQKFAETWERGVLHCEGVTPKVAEHIRDFSEMRVQADLWAPWERALLGEPGAQPPAMEWVIAQTKRGTKVEDPGPIYGNPLHYKFLKQFDATFDSEWANVDRDPDHIIKIGRNYDN